MNTKGIREKNLHDNINFHLKNSFLNLIPKTERKNQEDLNEGKDQISEILATLLTTQIPNESKPITRGRPKKSQPSMKKEILNFEIIENMLFKVELYFNDYLNQRSSRWLIEEEREKFVNLKFCLINLIFF